MIANFEAKRPLRVALVHDWLVAQRGGEQVLRALCQMWPDAPIYTLVHRPGTVHADIERHPIHQSLLGRALGLRRAFRAALPLMPQAIEAFDLRAYDLVISTSHCVAHGVRTGPQTFHLAYVHSPMRYLYDQMHHYLPAWGQRVSQPVARWASAPLRRWDRRAGARPDVVVANSAFVAARIERVWGRSASVLYPPVDVDFYAASAAPSPRAPASGRSGLVSVGALVPYKRTEIAVQLANRLQVPLTVVGTGPELSALRQMAGPWVTFRQGLTRAQLRQLYAGAQALIYAGEEDFGIVPIEAMAAGCPILALGRGGLTETVVGEGPAATGVWVPQATASAFATGLDTLRERLAQGGLRPETLRARAQVFSPDAFAQGLRTHLQQRLGPRGLAL